MGEGPLSSSQDSTRENCMIFRAVHDPLRVPVETPCQPLSIRSQGNTLIRMFTQIKGREHPGHDLGFTMLRGGEYQELGDISPYESIYPGTY